MHCLIGSATSVLLSFLPQRIPSTYRRTEDLHCMMRSSRLTTNSLSLCRLSRLIRGTGPMCRKSESLRCASSSSSSRNMSSMQALREDGSTAETASASRKQAKHTNLLSKSTASAPKVNFEYHSEKVTTDNSSPSELMYTGETTIPITSILHIVTPEEDTPSGIWPIFRLMVRASCGHFRNTTGTLSKLF